MSAHRRVQIASSGERPKLDGNTITSGEIRGSAGSVCAEQNRRGGAARPRFLNFNKSVVLKPVSSFPSSFPGVYLVND
jgi:hypothetical protein